MAIIRISNNVLEELKLQASKKAADLSSPIGEVFILETIPVAGIKLRVPLDEYLAKIDGRTDIVPTGDAEFPIVVNNEVTVRDKKTFIDGKEVILLP
ncbi:MAG TPA: hypothetical protein VMU07_00755 [Candidatus Paceibacterota bacterium]|nr:hypothetical protein [Candidatus Paceibacterota bacterium]